VEVAAKMAEVMAKVAKVAAKSAEAAGKKRITVADGAGAAAGKFSVRRVFPRGRGKRRLKADALTVPPSSAGFTMTSPAGWPWCLGGSRCGLSDLI
jgi:hypothetical protein